VILDEITMPQFERSLEGSRTVLIPFGSVEEHGPHLPLGTDTLQVYEVCRRAGERTGALVAPALPYGVCRSTRNHPGTVGIGTATLRALAVELGCDFYRQGLRNFVLISGHAGKTHLLTLVDAGEELLERLPDCRVTVISEYHEIQACGSAVVDTKDDSHAGEIETARVMHLRPDLVQGTAPAEWPTFPHALLVRDKRRYWPGGVWGDPGRATPEKGRRLTEIAVDRLVELIGQLEAHREDGGAPAPAGQP
jgi:creatinine amidohydrolase